MTLFFSEFYEIVKNKFK